MLLSDSAVVFAVVVELLVAAAVGLLFVVAVDLVTKRRFRLHLEVSITQLFMLLSSTLYYVEMPTKKASLKCKNYPCFMINL